MKVSSRGEYALRVLLDLATHSGEGVVPMADIARRTHVSIKYLEQILLLLKSMGLVGSKRGVHGGYELRVPPEQIMVGHVVRALEGPLAPMTCVSQTAYEPCPLEPSCLLRPLWLDIRNVVADILDHTSLADLMARSRQRADVIPTAAVYA
ncbi:MAG: Rrf2 family transcriptional regulator [Clostridia bacterium]|nr:Rrf2 family transcriptional regulator [Clostridia bacterium]